MNGTDPAQLLQVRTGTHGPIPVVTATGEVDVLSAPLLKRVIRQVLKADPPAVVVDLSRVAFMGSAGLAVQAACAQECASPLRVVAALAVQRPILVIGMHTPAAAARHPRRSARQRHTGVKRGCFAAGFGGPRDGRASTTDGAG
ncbi:STAS domain-containing protein [Nocardia sp. NPDC058480]|uniref:STAS domain-containing protein n=1 Tax=Nocardia sp. NPDC058480 TaxID=3346522 RepID=UPI00366928B8